MHQRGRSPQRGYSPMGRGLERRRSPGGLRRHHSPPRYLNLPHRDMGGPPPGDLRGPPPLLYDRRSPPLRGGPPPGMMPPRDLVVPSVRVTFKNPLQRPEDDPNNIPIMPRGRHAQGGVPPEVMRLRSRSPPLRHAMSPPRHRSPPRRMSPHRRAASPPPRGCSPLRRGMSPLHGPPPPFLDRLPPPGRGRSPPPLMRGGGRGMLPPPGYGRRRSPSPPPYARGPPPGMMGPPGMRRPRSRSPLHMGGGHPMSPHRMGRPLSPLRMGGRPHSPPRMGRLHSPMRGRPVTSPRYGRRPGSPGPGHMMMLDRMERDRGAPYLPERGGYPDPMDMLTSGRGPPPPMLDRRPPRDGPAPGARLSPHGVGPSNGGTAANGSRRQQAAAQPPVSTSSAPAVTAPMPEQVRALRVTRLGRVELAGLLRDRETACFFYEDPQGDIQGPHSVAQFQKWMSFLSTATSEEHQLAYGQFRSVAVWRKGMDVRVPLTELLEAATPKGAVGAARDLATGERPWEQRGYDAPWVEFCMKMCRVLLSASVSPVLVFDGCRLPAKATTNQQRRQRRADAKEKAQRLLKEGRDQEAQRVLMQCIDVTADMAHEVMVRLRERGIEFVVAPYEADAQLAYLSSIPEWEGGVAAVITEDSDLVAYGCRRVLFKMDTAGHCLELSLDRLFAGSEDATGVAAGGSGKGSGGGVLSLRGWTLDMLQAACVLAGCDFAPSLKGISFRTAASFVGRRRSLEGALKAIRLEKRFQLAATDEYCAAARQAALAFKHALVFCANTAGGSCRRLLPVPGHSSQQQQGAAAGVPSNSTAGGGEQLDLSHLGAELEAEVARGIAYGHLHPHTLLPFPAAGTTSCGGNSRQQQQQQMRPSMAGRRQLGSWMASGVAAHPGQHGLGPLQPALPPPPVLQQRQVQHQQQRGAADVSDVVQLCVPQQARPGVQRLQQQQADRQRSRKPFARHQPGGAADAMAAGPAVEAAASGTATEQLEQHGSCRSFLREAAEVQAGQDAAGEQQEPLGSWEEAGTAGPANPLSTAGSSWQQAQRQVTQRSAMQPITNLASQLPDSQQQSADTAFGSSSSGPCAIPSQQQEQQQQHRQQAQHSRPVWDISEQYCARAPRSAAAACGKRKISNSRGGGSAEKKATGKLLAPPAQRISRFFVPANKR